MVSYYASSSEPAQIRSKTVYVQYSNRQEIVNNKSSGDVPSNVLLVTFEGVEAGDVSIDVLHLTPPWKEAHVFSAFGFVQKIATFEKTAGFQALVQFSDVDTASSARSALDGRSIPRYLLPDHVGICHLHISFSAHLDLTVKYESHRSRDYTNLNLPVAPSAVDATGQFAVGADGKRKEPESNVLHASIENMQYDVTIEVLHQIFSAFGFVQKIAMFEKNTGLQALIQFQDVAAAVSAKEALEGHCIYDGGFCKLHLAYSRHTDLSVKANCDRSRDYTIQDAGVLNMQPSLLGPQPSGLMPSAGVTNTTIGDLTQQTGEVAGIMSNAPMVSGQVPNSLYGVTQVALSPSGVLPPPGYSPWGNPPSQSFSGPLLSTPVNPGFEYAQPPGFQLPHQLPPNHGSSVFLHVKWSFFACF
ncbi:hypothetical protein GOP47_0028467 [Adiantum capillus-veneris]|nr:hypothetical protein GOP47_0028467 [Adiantum capillus-veneris]